jgi:cellulose synthase/poly-beta-1,6-N-acetylglucosamine synthase-like glycosyltransferase
VRDPAILLFWLSVAFLAYAYVLFPLLVAVVGLLRRRDVRTEPITPQVSVIIAAYNEEANIEERLDNVLAAAYPSHRLQIIVASDGSTDATDEIVSRYASRGVLLLALPRRGKIHALDEAVRHATGDILVFSDANISWDRLALRALVRNFADPEVGGVCGRASYRVRAGSHSTSDGERLYFGYDTWLKILESRTGSIVSAHGALYAIRRRLYRPVTDSAVTDDFGISTAVVEQHYRLVFEPEAMATELAIPETQREFRRRVRLMTRGLRGVLMRRRLLNPFRYGFYSVVFWSHKVVRRLAPLALITMAIASAFAASAHPVYALAAAGQLAFYGIALAGFLLRGSRFGRMKLVYVPFYYCMANTAALIALVRFARRERIELWQPQRHGAAEGGAPVGGGR